VAQHVRPDPAELRRLAGDTYDVVHRLADTGGGFFGRGRCPVSGQAAQRIDIIEPRNIAGIDYKETAFAVPSKPMPI
jgi:hypothetical protein